MGAISRKAPVPQPQQSSRQKERGCAVCRHHLLGILSICLNKATHTKHSHPMKLPYMLLTPSYLLISNLLYKYKLFAHNHNL